MSLPATALQNAPVQIAAPAAAEALRQAGQWLSTRLDEEQGRWFLWLPVFFATGIGLYFSLSSEPSIALGVSLLLLAATLRVYCRNTMVGLILSSIAMAAAAGFAASQMRTAIVAAPVLDYRGVFEVTGITESAERISRKRWRVVLRVLSLSQENKETPPAAPYRIRISINGEEGPKAGSLLKLKAVLLPPNAPVRPGAHDFARVAYFQATGATGFALGKAEYLPDADLPAGLQFATFVAGVRSEIAARIKAVLPGQTGAIAAALLVGERAELSDAVEDSLRASGLYHVISISGLHMAIVAGTLYWIIRALLAFVPAIALRYPLKRYAAFFALICATVYLCLSGAAVAALRAYVMIAVMFCAMMLNRPAFSMRNVAISAGLILAVYPESLLDASFQMSFAATAALAAVYEAHGHRLRFRNRGLWHMLLVQPFYILAAVSLTTIVAGLATAPLSAYHFHNAVPYSVLGNLLGGPPVDFIVMPFGVLAMFAMPLGLEEWPLTIMGFGIDLMMAASKLVASLDGAVAGVPAFPAASLLLMVVGGLWLLLWRRRWRLAGLAPIALGMAIMPLKAKPDIYIDREGKAAAVRLQNGLLSAPKTSRASYSLEQWLKADGDLRKAKDAAKGEGYQCDASSCIIYVKGRLVAIVSQPDALDDDCKRAAILITAMTLRQPCLGPLEVFDAGRLQRLGAAAIFISGQGQIEVLGAQAPRGDRPWSQAAFRQQRFEMNAGAASSSGEQNLPPDADGSEQATDQSHDSAGEK